MHFLLSNDDGYQAAGLVKMASALSKLGMITVVAPDRDRSGASNSLTLDSPLYPRTASNGFIYVNGTPTDCVHLAITGMLETDPDMVVSGINAGANLGDDVLYSGTVAAAMEGRFLGCPAIAVSLTSRNPRYYDTAVQVVINLVRALPVVRSDLLLNVNVPDIPYDNIGTYEITRLGQRHKSEPAVPSSDSEGHAMYWVGPAGPEQIAGPGTDFHAIRNNNVSITPLQVDLTRHGVIDELQDWAGELNRHGN